MNKATITNADLIIIGRYMQVFKQATLKGKIGYRFAKLLRKLTSKIEEWEEVGRKPIFEKYAVEMSESVAEEINRLRQPGSTPVEAKTMYIPTGSAKSREYDHELSPLLNDTIEIEYMNIPLPDFINALGQWPESFWYDSFYFLWDDEDLPDSFTPDFEKKKDKDKDK